MNFLSQKNNYLIRKKSWVAGFLVLIIIFISILIPSTIRAAGYTGNSNGSILQPSNGQILSNYTFTPVGGKNYINSEPVTLTSSQNNIDYYKGDNNGSIYAVNHADNSVIGVNDANVQAGGTTPTNNGTSIEQELYNQCLPGWFQIHFDWCFAGVSYMVMKGISFIFWMVGVVFDFIIDYTVVKMAASINAISALNIAWKAFRDLANIFFIFILLYIAIATILRLSSFDTKKLLMKVIIVALLINFSLFFTKVIIDASNQLAYAFYTKITLTGSGGDVSKSVLGGNPAAAGLADAFLGPLQLTSIYNPGTSNSAGQPSSGIFSNTKDISKNDPRQIFEICLLGTIVIAVAAMVFLAACIIFVVRFITLIILMMFSAIAFMGMILPRTAQYSTSWWNKLFSEALVAPAFFMMIWVTIAVIGSHGLSGIAVNGGFATFANGTRAAAGVLLNFAIVIGLLAGSLIVSKLTGASGGALALNAFNGVRNATQGLIGRNTIGEIGRRMEERFSQSKVANIPFFDAIRRGTTQRLASAKFGSGTSRDEAYRHGQELELKRGAAEKANNVRAAVTQMRKYAEGSADWQQHKDEGEKWMSQMSPHEVLAAFSRPELQNKDYVSMTNAAQLKTIHDDKEKLNEIEKEHMLTAKFGPVTETWRRYLDKLNTEISTLRTNLITSGYSRPDAEAEAQFEAMRSLEKDPDMLKAKKELRAMLPDEFDLFALNHPDVIKNPNFTPMIRWSDMENNLRKSRYLTRKQRDDIRSSKYSPLVKALALPKATTVQIDKRNNAIRSTMSDYFARKEIVGAPSTIRLDKDMFRFYDRSILEGFNDRDEYEKVEIGKSLRDAVNKREMTKEQLNSWEWTTDPRTHIQGKLFYSTMVKNGVSLPEFNKTTVEADIAAGRIRIIN